MGILFVCVGWGLFCFVFKKLGKKESAYLKIQWKPVYFLPLWIQLTVFAHILGMCFRHLDLTFQVVILFCIVISYNCSKGPTSFYLHLCF